MNAIEPPVAIRRLDTDREDAFALEAVGHVTAADVENIYGLMEAAVATHDKIDMLLRIKDYEGVDWDAMMRDLGLLGKSDILKHVRRYAVVGGPGWIGPMIAVSKPFFSVEMRHFETDEEVAAWHWIGASEIPPET